MSTFLNFKHLLSFFSLVTIFSTGIAYASDIDRPFGQRSLLSDQAIAERLQPIGKVCVKGDDCGSGMTASSSGDSSDSSGTQVASAGAGKSPEDIYTSKCAMCHDSGMAGAPKTGDAAAWQARIDEKGLDGIVKTAISGINAMPAMGMCMECSDEDIKLTVEYIVENSK